MSFKEAAREWRAEVDAEAARLIQLGIPPWDAVIQARQRVEQRRRENAYRPVSPAQGEPQKT